MMGSLFNHLWQSTLFAIAAGLLTLGFRRNRAQVRYWLWFSASIKFIIPMAGLMAVGGFIYWLRPAKSAMPAVSLTMVQVAEPFADPAEWPGGPFRPAPLDRVMLTLWTIWLIGFAAIIVMRFRMWRRIQGLLGSSTPFEIPDVTIPASIQVRAVPGLMEPGVIGWLRPVLLVPSDITAQLSPAQLKAIVVHEMAHIRRRDNLTSAIHMIVEAVFWFHP
jgi:beta-lactamase regulating signal transducer with metallopeptidase domain